MKQSPDLLSVHLPPENQWQKLTDICFLHMSKPLKLVPCILHQEQKSTKWSSHLEIAFWQFWIIIAKQ